MYRFLLTIFILTISFQLSGATDSAQEAYNVPQFIQWLLKEGKDRVVYDDRAAQPLGLPPEGAPSKSWGTGNSNPFRACSLIIEQSGNNPKSKPICLILFNSTIYPELRKSKLWHFRFGLDGTFETAVSAIGDLQADGQPIRASAVNITENVKNPAVQSKAQEELNFWLQKTYALANQATHQEAFTMKKLIEWLLREGKDRIGYNDQRAELLGLPMGGVPSKAWGTGLSNPFHGCSLILEKSTDTQRVKPICLIFLNTTILSDQHKSKHWHFRFQLDGTLEKVISAAGAIDKDGQPIRGSAVDTVENIKDPEVQAKAKEELDFWLQQAYALAKPPEPPKKPSTSPGQ